MEEQRGKNITEALGRIIRKRHLFFQITGGGFKAGITRAETSFCPDGVGSPTDLLPCETVEHMFKNTDI